MSEHASIFVPSLRMGGAERFAVNLCKGLISQNWRVHLLLAKAEGDLLGQIPSEAEVFDFARGRVSRSIFQLARYLRLHQPSILLSVMTHANLAALAARNLARTRTKVVVTEHNCMELNWRSANPLKVATFTSLMRRLYPRADGVVAVSQGVAKSIAQVARVSPEVIYNPVITPEIFRLAEEPIEHPWFQQREYKIVLGVGRLTTQKDFATLLRAFAIVRQQAACKLVIFGEGEERARLHNLAESMGLNEDVSMPGIAMNPYKYMRAADVFVLSSIWEGLPTVVIEALAMGTPIVATDCPHGPAEILRNGQLGRLCPVGDAEAMAHAILDAITEPRPRVEPEIYSPFTVSEATEKYIRLFRQIMTTQSG